MSYSMSSLKYGISLDVVKYFINSSGGEGAFRGLSTIDVCENFIKPLTRSRKLSYCEWFSLQSESITKNGKIAPANVFISHVWKYRFLDVIRSIFIKFKNKRESVIIWLDIFSCNLNSVERIDFRWYQSILRPLIQDIGHTVLVVSSWSDIICLQRTWCLGEVFYTADMNSKLEILMSSDDQKQMLYDLKRDVTAVLRRIQSIDIALSDTTNQSDKTSILSSLRYFNGIDLVNCRIQKSFREWMLLYVQQTLSSEDLDGDLVSQTELKLAVAELYQANNTYDQAEQGYLQCLAQLRTLHGNRHYTTLMCMRGLAEVYCAIGKLAAAEPLRMELLETAHSIGGPDSEDTLAATEELGMLYFAELKYDLARPLLKNCLELRRRVLGDTHPCTLQTLGNLADVHMKRGQYESAEPLLMQCLEGWNVYDNHHCEGSAALKSLVEVYRQQSKFDHAETLCKLRLDKLRAAVGLDHISYQQCVELLSSILQSQDKSELAESTYTDYIGELHHVIAEDNPTILATMVSLATLYLTNGKHVAAEELLGRCLSLRRQKLGNKHLDTLECVYKLGVYFTTRQRYEEAESMLTECVVGRKQVLGALDKRTREAAEQLAVVRTKLGGRRDGKENNEKDKSEELRKLMEETESTEETSDASSQKDLIVGSLEELQRITDLGLLYFSQGKYELAEPLFVDSLSLSRTKLGMTHIDTLTRLNNLGNLYLKQNRFDAAEPLYKECVDLLRTKLGSQHVSTMAAVNNLARVYDHLRKTDLAEQLYVECLCFRRDMFGNEHPDTLRTMHKLGVLYGSISSYTLAETFLNQCWLARKHTLGENHPDTECTKSSLDSIRSRMSSAVETKKSSKFAIGSKGFVKSNKVLPELLMVRSLL